MTTSPLDFPAINGRTVTEGHSRLCRERGHAKHTVDGVETGTCPRCGDVVKIMCRSLCGFPAAGYAYVKPYAGSPAVVLPYCLDCLDDVDGTDGQPFGPLTAEDAADIAPYVEVEHYTVGPMLEPTERVLTPFEAMCADAYADMVTAPDMALYL